MDDCRWFGEWAIGDDRWPLEWLDLQVSGECSECRWNRQRLHDCFGCASWVRNQSDSTRRDTWKCFGFAGVDCSDDNGWFCNHRLSG